MRSVDQYGEAITNIGKFVEKLPISVQGEAFKFLLARELGSPAQTQDGGKRDGRGMSPQELLRSSGRVKLVEKAEMLSYWLEMDQGKESFSSGELKEAFETAREKAPKNTSDVVSSLVASGKLMVADKIAGVQKFRLTGTAIDEVEGWTSSRKSE